MDYIKHIWPEWPVNKRRAHFYALRCIGHRLRKFGFEKSVNMLDARSMLALALMAHKPMSDALRDEAIKKDPSLESLLTQEEINSV